MPLRTRAGFRSVGLFVNHRYRIERATGTASGRWTAVTSAYRYDILDLEGREILAYHWHPFALGPGFPHLHLSSRIGVLPVGEQAPPVALGEMHLPTEEVTFPAIVRLLLGEVAVAPRRYDWEAIVAESDAACRAQRARPA